MVNTDLKLLHNCFGSIYSLLVLRVYTDVITFSVFYEYILIRVCLTNSSPFRISLMNRVSLPIG